MKVVDSFEFDYLFDKQTIEFLKWYLSQFDDDNEIHIHYVGNDGAFEVFIVDKEGGNENE